MRVGGKDYRTIWMEGAIVKTINQPLLPHRFEIIDLPDHHATARAIKTMIVRGAGAIGSAGAYGMAQVYIEAAAASDPAGRGKFISAGYETLRTTRPTAQD